MSYLAQAILSSWLSGAGTSLRSKKLKYSMATCPDKQCGTVLYFPTHEQSVECIGCGQRHAVSSLSDCRELNDKEEEVQRSLTEMKSIYGGKKTPELVKVKGISNYQCKLLSPFLTTHGKDKNDQPRPLKELGMGDTFDCSKLGSRAFAIESSLLGTTGYGKDRSGSVKYLSDTLDILKESNGGVECLVPVHADGDGHCLVHAVSRCLVGRELFWHALRTNMQSHLQHNKDKYAEMLKDFYEKEEWPEIINEAGPDYQPPEGQSLGLRTVHIFALANVLRRPIILLDSITGMQSKGDYSGIFLPYLYSPEECCTQGTFNSPIVIAWSSSGYNHFIPLVPIKDTPLPKLPYHIRPKVWGVDESLLHRYTNIDQDNSITVAGGKPLQDTYLQKLVACMEQLFYKYHGVTPSLVADVNQYAYRSVGCVGVSLDTVTMETKMAVEENRLFRCLVCNGISIVPEDWLCKDGTLYAIADNEYSLQDGQNYSFPRYGITAEYKSDKDILIATEVKCFQCSQLSRRMGGDGVIWYQNGDRTQTRADPTYSKCCGFKHYWDGKEYDNMPEIIQLSLTWKGRKKTVRIPWFQNEKEPSLNSNVFEVAYQTVSEYFPGEFGSEQLVQQVVEMVLSATENKNTEQVEHDQPLDLMETESSGNVIKSIATGMNKTTKVLHKEELGMSEAERGIKRRVDQKLQQKKHQQQQQETANKFDGNKTGRKTSPSPRDTTTPPSKISPTTKPSPPSPSSTGCKKIRVTSSDGRNANLTLTPSSTFTDLQTMIENELDIPSSQQKLRWGFPPRELTQPDDPLSPLPLTHGEKVSVERIALSIPVTSASSGASNMTSTANKTGRGALEGLGDSLRSYMKDSSTFDELSNFPNLFKKGGYCYEELIRSYGNKLKDNMHVQFSEMQDVVFRLNLAEECLEVCLGIEHIPVGPLTPQQRELAKMAATQNDDDPTKSNDHSASNAIKWLLNRSSDGSGGGSNVKAFSGTGHTLGGESTASSNPTSITDQRESSSSGSSTSYEQTLLQAAQLIVSTRMNDLKQKEKELQNEIHTLNERLQQASSIRQSNEELDEDDLIPLERTLLNMSSELKEVRDEIRELSKL